MPEDDQDDFLAAGLDEPVGELSGDPQEHQEHTHGRGAPKRGGVVVPQKTKEEPCEPENFDTEPGEGEPIQFHANSS